jgi:ribonuclease D
VKGARDLTRRELARLRELVQWRDGVAAELDRATFRVAANEVLLEAARRAPRTVSELLDIKGVPRALVERRGRELLDAIKRGDAVRDADLPKFPRGQRWERDTDFDENVARLKRVRDDAAKRLSIEPGFLCSRDRLEAVARRKPETLEHLSEVKDLRRWQIGVLGGEFLAALKK